MGSKIKSLPLILILIMAILGANLLIVKPASAQSAPVSSIPQFTIKFVPASYIMTPSNPYTGANTTAEIDNNTIAVTIKNQPFVYGDNYHLNYDVRIKPHFSQNWSDLYPTISLFSDSNLSLAQYISTKYSSNNTLSESNSAYTTLSLSAGGYPPSGQIDFQVAAEIGVNSTFYSVRTVGGVPIGAGEYESAIAYVSASGWSNTQTITIPASSTSASPSPTSTTTPAVPEFPTWIFLLLLSVMVSIGLFVYLKKRKH